MATRLQTVLSTTLELAERFSQSLASPTVKGIDPTEHTNPLPLLSDAAETLKAQVTKLSLLAISTPFSPSALIKMISTVNDIVLPALVTATQRLVPEQHTQTLFTEARALVTDALSEYISLIRNVKVTAALYTRDPSSRLDDETKRLVTTATGRVWKVCDQIMEFVLGGIMGVIIKKTRESLALVRDAIRELKEWDPAESLDPDAFWDGLDDDDNPANIRRGEDTPGEDEDEDEAEDNDGNQHAKLVAEQQYLLRLLKLVTQLHTAAISHRLHFLLNESVLPKYAQALDTFAQSLRKIPDLVDEAAGSLYEHDIQLSSANSLKLQDEMRMAVDRMTYEPWTSRPLPGVPLPSTVVESDFFWQWASRWLKALDELEENRKQ